MARTCQLGRGLGTGQRQGTDGQETWEIPLTPTGEACRNGDRRLTMGPGPVSVLHADRERLGEYENRRSAWDL
jgi:hypothetical protein